MNNALHVLIGSALGHAGGVCRTCERTPSTLLALLEESRQDDRPDAWFLLGVFEDDRRSKDRWKSSGGLILDFDFEDPTIPRDEGAHQAMPDEYRSRVLNAMDDYPVPGIVYATPRGVRICHVLVEDVDDLDTYEELVGGAAERFLAHIEERGVETWRQGVTGLRYDTASNLPCQAMRLPLVDQPIVMMGANRAVHTTELHDAETPRLDLDAAFPEWIAEACRQIARWVQVAPEIAVSGLMVLVAATAGNARWVGVRGFRVPLSLQVLTILTSGAGKSTVRKFLRELVRGIELLIRKQRAKAWEEYNKYQAELAEWNSKNKSTREGVEAGVRPRAPSLGPEGGRRVSFILSEATLEGVLASEEDTPRGLLWASDEAHDILGVLGHYGDSTKGRGLDAARLRRLFDSQPVEIHRAKSNSAEIRTIPLPWLAMDADVQPGVWEGMFTEEDRVSGLTARLLIHKPTSMLGRRKYVSPPPEPEPWVREDLTLLLERLWRLTFELKDGVPEYELIQLNDRAESLWAEELERLERLYTSASDEEAGALGHARGRVLRLAGVLALMRDPETLTVTEKDMSRAILHMRYYSAHHRRLLGSAQKKGLADRLGKLRGQAERILEQQPEKGVSPRDLAQRVGRRYQGEDGRQRAVADLHAIEWEVRRPPWDGRGRKPQPAWYPPGKASTKSTKRTHSVDSVDTNPDGDARDILDRASARLIEEDSVELPPPGQRVRCPICGSSDGFGVLPGDPTRWYCHSDRHQKGGCAVDLLLGEQLGRDPTPAEAVEEAKRILGTDTHSAGERLQNLRKSSSPPAPEDLPSAEREPDVKSLFTFGTDSEEELAERALLVEFEAERRASGE